MLFGETTEALPRTAKYWCPLRLDVVTPAWCIHASFAVPLQIEPLHHRIHAGATPCNTGDLPADPLCNQIHPRYVLDIV
jgi:hypothetical protein